MGYRERGFTTQEQRKAILRQPLDQKLTAARYKFERTVGSASPEELESTELEFKAAKLDVESYDFERDATGAWKGESLGVDLNRVHEGLLKEDGSLDSEKSKNMHVVQINMGELDRLNKVYGHEVGNQALSDTCQLIYHRLEEVLGEAAVKKSGQEPAWEDLEEHFDIYRSSGNDFTVILRDVDEGVANQIQKILNSDLRVEMQGKEESVPLSATRVPMADAVDYFNDNQENISGSNPGRVFVDVVKEQSQILNDIEKNNRRIDRVLKMGDEEKARALYENYLKKTLGRLFVADPAGEAMGYEAFRDALKGSKDEGLEQSITLAIGDFRLRQKEAHYLSKTLSKFVFDKKREDLLKSKGVELNEEEVLSERKTVETGGQGADEVKDEAEFLGQLPPTAGEKEVEGLKNEVKRLEALAQSDPENKTLKARLAFAESQLHNSEVKRNSATGLYERGMFFNEIKSSLAENRPLTVVAIDMAFLKYFDKEGGRKTGNSAIKMASRILDKAVAELDPSLKATAYRTGGDEFALTVGTDDQEVIRKIQKQIREIAGELPVPALDQGRSQQYRSEELNFNFGSYAAADMASLRQELTDAQFHLKADQRNRPAMVEESADYLFRIADRQVEIEKTIQRFMLLTRRYYLENFGGETPKGNYQTLENYSAKAIGDDGPALIRGWAEEMAEQKKQNKDLDWSALQRKVLEYVIAKGMEETERQAQEGEFTDRLLAAAVRERFLKQRLGELQDNVKSLRSDLDKADKDKDSLMKKISELEAEIQTVGQLRQQINKG